MEFVAQDIGFVRHELSRVILFDSADCLNKLGRWLVDPECYSSFHGGHQQEVIVKKLYEQSYCFTTDWSMKMESGWGLFSVQGPR